MKKHILYILFITQFSLFCSVSNAQEVESLNDFVNEVADAAKAAVRAAGGNGDQGRAAHDAVKDKGKITDSTADKVKDKVKDEGGSNSVWKAGRNTVRNGIGVYDALKNYHDASTKTSSLYLAVAAEKAKQAMLNSVNPESDDYDRIQNAADFAKDYILQNGIPDPLASIGIAVRTSGHWFNNSAISDMRNTVKLYKDKYNEMVANEGEPTPPPPPPVEPEPEPTPPPPAPEPEPEPPVDYTAQINAICAAADRAESYRDATKQLADSAVAEESNAKARGASIQQIETAVQNAARHASEADNTRNSSVAQSGIAARTAAGISDPQAIACKNRAIAAANEADDEARRAQSAAANASAFLQQERDRIALERLNFERDNPVEILEARSSNAGKIYVKIKSNTDVAFTVIGVGSIAANEVRLRKPDNFQIIVSPRGEYQMSGNVFVELIDLRRRLVSGEKIEMELKIDGVNAENVAIKPIRFHAIVD